MGRLRRRSLVVEEEVLGCYCSFLAVAVVSRSGWWTIGRIGRIDRSGMCCGRSHYSLCFAAEVDWRSRMRLVAVVAGSSDSAEGDCSCLAVSVLNFAEVVGRACCTSRFVAVVDSEGSMSLFYCRQSFARLVRARRACTTSRVSVGRRDGSARWKAGGVVKYSRW